MANDRQFVRAVVDDLAQRGFRPVVFGGWAEELLGLSPARPHRDLDLLLVDADRAALDRELRDRHEVPVKRFPHQRAFVDRSVLVELVLVDLTGGVPITEFWGAARFVWPADVEGTVIDGVPVASPAAIAAYRRGYARLMRGHRSQARLLALAR